MTPRVHDKLEAQRLRRLGASYSEIISKLNVSKGTLSGWLHLMELSKEEEINLQQKLSEKKIEARFRTVLTNHNRRLTRDAIIIDKSSEFYRLHCSDRFFLAGILLYWGEGSKKGRAFSFINSDPEMTRIMVEWIERYLDCPRSNIAVRAYIHKVYEQENCEAYWSKIISIPREKFRKTTYKKDTHLFKRNPNYKGCLELRVHKVEAYVRVMAWQKLLIEDILDQLNSTRGSIG